MNPEEKVLCIRRTDLPKDWVGTRSVLKINEDSFFKTCGAAGFHWLARGVVETDPNLKQIIPYIIIQTLDRELTAVYRRMGSETRLHDLWSAGIGGHINPEDNGAASKAASFREILVTGMERELDEELEKRPGNLKPAFLGIINEEITDVGKVHLGAVFTLTALETKEFVPGKELTNFQWVRTRNLTTLNLELWSELAMDLIRQPG
ncbi:MAG: phosphoesterase [Pseudomonadota bacterium]